MAKLRELRESLNLSGTRLCQLSGVTVQRISAHERGTHKLNTDERVKVWGALRSEVDRIKELSIGVNELGFE